MALEGYEFDAAQLPGLLTARFYPERTDRESALMREYLLEHYKEFDRVMFSARLGPGYTPDPTLPEAIQKQQRRVTQKKVDMLAWRGLQPVLIEAKYLVSPSALGQILGYRQLLQEELPDAPEPDLVVIGRASDPDTIRILTAHGVTVEIYPDAQPAGATAGGGV